MAGFAQQPPTTNWVQYVDPLIGTGLATTASAKAHSEAQSELKGQTFPAVGVPFGMTHWTPQTRTTERKCISPYYHADTKISGFRGSHWMSGSCTQDYGSVTIMPTTGAVEVNPEKYASAFSHATEKASPAAYAVNLTSYNIDAEITATSRTGLLQFRFNQAAEQAPLIIYPNSDEGQAQLSIDVGKNEISGYNPVHRIYQGQGKPAGFSGYFVIQFSKPFKTAGTFRDGSVSTQITVTGEGKSAGGYVTYAVQAGDIIKVKVGTSFTSIAEARRNLEAEIPAWDLNKVKDAATAAWNKALGSVQVRDNNTEKKTIFYTALYHTMLLPRVYSDVSGTYPAFAQQYKTERTNDFEFHGDFSLWDTYRAVHPLYVLLQPERARAMVSTLISMSESGGWLPNFPCWNSYTSAMIADHGASVIADAYIKGIRGFDAEKAYRYMRKNALEPAGPEDYADGRGRRALPSYIKYGYIPMEDSVWQAFHKREQVSRTLEYAYDDFAVSQLAKALGKEQDYQLFLKRSNNYKNIYDSQSGFMRGRHADGSWYKDINPNKKEIYITEGTPWQYTYSVQQDVPGLVTLMGGKEKFGQRLDAFFDQKQYWHGNEPGHHIAYLFNYADTPWKTQRRVNEIITTEYGSGPGGISGNDDTGQTSAWYVFSAMGFYPVTPGTPYYIIGTPQFKEISLPVGHNRSFRIRAENLSPANIYVQSATLNGKTYNNAYLRHNDILTGGVLVFKMGNVPNKRWATTTTSMPK
ncbi:hypothetical protein AAE02nite_30140 [Adhaeribacter aerolatus]|uniref:Alpha-1 2-mannosidase n=1 Tax=Adhaeribacter aerolatus TaxID=670289 RepID=A0A512B065_9BACT|nr:hypothetical protein AAE02nite_30140 [Adhaeribacter aerolatus]